MNLRLLFLMFLLALTLVRCTPAETTPASIPMAQYNASDEDLEAIQQAALDYIEGWYEGDPLRMERSLHPQLVKRIIRGNHVDTLSAEQMVTYTQQGGGKAFTGQKENIVTLLDVYHDIATVKAESAEYIDYLHIGKVNGSWVIINVLWTVKRSE